MIKNVLFILFTQFRRALLKSELEKLENDANSVRAQVRERFIGTLRGLPTPWFSVDFEKSLENCERQFKSIVAGENAQITENAGKVTSPSSSPVDKPCHAEEPVKGVIDAWIVYIK